MVWGYKNIRIGKKTKLEHRLIMEKHLGRKLDRFEVVHHKNRNKKDNKLSNFKVQSLSEHTSEFMKKYMNLPEIKERYRKYGKKYGFQPTRYKKGRYWCNGCKKYLSRSNFWPDKYNGKYKLRTYCKECDKPKARLLRRIKRNK